MGAILTGEDKDIFLTENKLVASERLMEHTWWSHVSFIPYFWFLRKLPHISIVLNKFKKKIHQYTETIAFSNNNKK